MRALFRLFVVMTATAALLVATVAAVAPRLGQLAGAHRSEPEDIDLSRLDDFAVRSYVYANDGSLLTAWHGPENRQPVPLPSVPRPVVESIVAVEDEAFYDHAGVNLKATFRALVENVSAGGVAQGGSTITQQLVKNTILNADQNFGRKSQEAAIAVRLEQKLTDLAGEAGASDPRRRAKDQILEQYLNTVYLGSGAYGVQAAAETYWGKSVQELGWPEAAMLAALISNPVGYDPTLHPERARKQRQLALDRLVQVGKITPDQAAEYATDRLPTARCSLGEGSQLVCDGEQGERKSYFTEEVKTRLLTDPAFAALGATREERKKALYEGGLRIHTTIDPQAQQVAEDVARNVVPSYVRDRGIVAALVSVEPETGAVRTMVGGGEFNADTQFNITTSPHRQAGSTMKYFTLLTALEQGNLPGDYVGGEGFSIVRPGEEPYTPKGPGGTLDSVTGRSSNAAFVRLQKIVDGANVVEMARRLGLTDPLLPVSSLTLGSFGVKPIEMASAYSAAVNGGDRHPYYVVDRIEDRTGKTLYQHTPSTVAGVPPAVACNATQILVNNVNSGTGTRARLSRQPAAGKTGTTDKGADVWFVGSTPYLTTAVWMGDPREASVKNEYLPTGANMGGFYPAIIWHDFNEAYHAGRPVRSFPVCPFPNRGPRNAEGRGDRAWIGDGIGKDAIYVSRPSSSATPVAPAATAGAQGQASPAAAAAGPPTRAEGAPARTEGPPLRAEALPTGTEGRKP